MANQNSNGKHRKHTLLKKTKRGSFFRNEWGFLGAPCSAIHQLVASVIAHIGDRAQAAYMDADHQAGTLDVNARIISDKIAFHRVDHKRRLNTFDLKIACDDVDIGLVNSNHFEAQKQVVIINEKKRDSLLRKMERLTDVRLILLDDDETEVYDFIAEHLKTTEVPVWSIHDTEKIAEKMLTEWFAEAPPVYGLVLAGGESRRMGKDKSLVKYHLIDQASHAAGLMDGLAEQIFFSLKKGQSKPLAADYERITDVFTELGPYGAILSAFRQHPGAAWCVVACDQPLLQRAHLETLFDERDVSKMATCFHNPETGFPEPLITIWEPKSYKRLLDFLHLGYSCPRKVLINSEVKEVMVKDADFLKNANTPEEMQRIKKELGHPGA